MWVFFSGHCAQLISNSCVRKKKFFWNKINVKIYIHKYCFNKFQKKYFTRQILIFSKVLNNFSVSWWFLRFKNQRVTYSDLHSTTASALPHFVQKYWHLVFGVYRNFLYSSLFLTLRKVRNKFIHFSRFCYFLDPQSQNAQTRKKLSFDFNQKLFKSTSWRVNPKTYNRKIIVFSEKQLKIFFYLSYSILR